MSRENPPYSTRKAAQAYADFTGAQPKGVRTAKLDDRDVNGWKLGKAVGVAYRATRDGQTKEYFHEFKQTAAPDVVSRDDGRQLYFAGGSYKVTDRGIEDMPKLFVVNPSPRSGGRTKPKRKAPMARRRTATRRRRHAPRAIVVQANPIRRRRRRARVSTRRRAFRANPARRSVARNPIRRRRRVGVRRMRRNPSARGMGGGAVNFGRMLIPAMGIGAGAVGSEILMGYLPIPANFKTGVLRHVTKGAVGIAAGLLIGKVFKMKRLGNFFALGAVAIATHDALKELIASRASSINQTGFGQYRGRLPSQFGYINPARTGRMGQYLPRPLPSQFPGSFAGMGGDAPTVATQPVGGETDFRA